MHPLHACAWSVEHIRVQGKVKLALFQQMIEDFSGQSYAFKCMQVTAIASQDLSLKIVGKKWGFYYGFLGCLKSLRNVWESDNPQDSRFVPHSAFYLMSDFYLKQLYKKLHLKIGRHNSQTTANPRHLA